MPQNNRMMFDKFKNINNSNLFIHSWSPVLHLQLPIWFWFVPILLEDVESLSCPYTSCLKNQYFSYTELMFSLNVSVLYFSSTLSYLSVFLQPWSVVSVWFFSTVDSILLWRPWILLSRFLFLSNYSETSCCGSLLFAINSFSLVLWYSSISGFVWLNWRPHSLLLLVSSPVVFSACAQGLWVVFPLRSLVISVFFPYVSLLLLFFLAP